MRLSSRGIRIYYVDRKRFILLLTLIFVFLLLLTLVLSQGQLELYQHYYIRDFDAEHLSIYFETGYKEGIPWYYLAAIDRAERVPDREISYERCKKIASYLKGLEEKKEAEDIFQRLKAYRYRTDRKFYRRLRAELAKMDYLISIYEDKVFPIEPGYDYDYSDGYGEPRSYGGDRSHEGIDIMCSIGTPLVSVCDGIVEKMGWLELGGWRIGIRGEDGIYYYYAHLSEYREGLQEGDKVKKGELIGYAGDTGYGPEGTTGQFLPHLHFGMYEREGFANRGERAVNPFPFLKAWERNSIKQG